jgi:AcrR family transcriptional regulator
VQIDMEADRESKPSEQAHELENEALRARLLDSLLAVLKQRSYPQLRTADLLAAAEVSESEFASTYPSLDACFAELCQGFMREAAEETFAAYVGQPSWREGMRAQIWASHNFLVADHPRARICVIDVNFAGDGVLAIRDLFMAAFTELVHLGRHESPEGRNVPRERAEAIAGSAWERIAAPIRIGSFESLIEVVPQILYMLYLPYLGEAEARAELSLARAEVERRRQASR